MKPWPFAVAALLTASSASAAEVQFEGFYRARMRVFDTLSLKRGVDQSLGTSWVIQHRLWVRPKFFVTEKVGLFADVLALNNYAWGTNRNPWFDPGSLPPFPVFSVENMPFPDAEDDGKPTLPPVQLWRAWGEFRTKVGTFKVGRIPLHWGLGIWRNDGRGDQAEYGDSADRVSWEHVVQDVWLNVAFNLNTYGYIQNTDPIWSIDVAGAYRSERMNGGLLFQYRRDDGDQEKFDLFTLDGTADLQFGFVGLDAEAIFQFGSGNLGGGINNVKTFDAGFVLDASANLDRFEVHVEGGMATGDKDPTDAKLGTFWFDRDYNLGIFLFEQPMPALKSTTPGTDWDISSAQSHNAVSNAGYLRPRMSFRAVEGFFVDAQVVAAWPFATPTAVASANRKGPYGAEVDLSLRYTGIQHLELGGTAALFVPGKYYGNLTADTLTGFNAVSGGGQVWARVRF